MSQCEAFGLLQAEAASEVERVIEVVNQWRTHFVQAGVTAHDIESLGERIDGEELLKQRLHFDPARYRTAKAKRKQPGPFRQA
jgi:serine/threonine-protein kinase HipA